MKTIKKFQLTAIILAVLFSTTTLPANSESATILPSLQFDTSPPKKKCRKCSRFSPVRMFKKGQLDASFGMGLLPTFLVDDAKVKLLPVTLGLEYRFAETFSLGVIAGHSVSESKPKLIADGIEARWENSFYHIALRPAVHITRIEGWDFYGGFSIGMNLSNIDGRTNNKDIDLQEYEKHFDIEASRANIAFSGIAGVRYVLSPKWTVGGELGFGISIFTVGVNHFIN